MTCVYIKINIEAYLYRCLYTVTKYFKYSTSAKYFGTYDLNDKVSPSPRIVKFSGLGQAKSFEVDNAYKLISSGRVSTSDEGPHGLKPNIEIVCLGKPLGSPVVVIKGSSPRVQLTGLDVAILVVLLFVIFIQSIAPPTMAINEIKAHLESSLVEICKQKLKAIIDQTIDEHNKLPAKAYKPCSKRQIEPLFEGVQKMMNFLDADHSLTKCMRNE
ncbi:hypothetical protein Cgig2_002049 [Carnegiea gigantea]|uniref:Uncharacterized protein n=1 Tax=Carnegiea gigantea TaxID=171969 RepID=A0A9Q1JXI0_9CARY|nr:hypothetical protein Cgig2_002049 [Carnegiea gigantea]